MSGNPRSVPNFSALPRVGHRCLLLPLLQHPLSTFALHRHRGRVVVYDPIRQIFSNTLQQIAARLIRAHLEVLEFVKLLWRLDEVDSLR